MQTIEDILQCPICIGTLTKPIITTRCSHTYCYKCISQLGTSDKCPVCRSQCLQGKNRFRNLPLEKVLDEYRKTRFPNIDDFSSEDNFPFVDGEFNPEKSRFYITNTMGDNIPEQTRPDYRSTNPGWHLACTHEVEYYKNEVSRLVYDWYIVVLDGGTLDCRVRGNKVVYDPQAHFGHGHPEPGKYGSYGAKLVSKNIETVYQIQSRDAELELGWRRVCTHDAYRDLIKIRELVEGQSYDDEIALLGGYITQDCVVKEDQKNLLIGNWSWDVGRFAEARIERMASWRAKDSRRANMLIQKVYVYPHQFYWDDEDDMALGASRVP